MPSEIAESLGFTGQVKIEQDIIEAITEVIVQNPQLVAKMQASKSASPSMKLVSMVLAKIGRKSDPVVIQHLIQEEASLNNAE